MSIVGRAENELLERLMAAAAHAPAATVPPPAVTEYDWKAPSCFTRQQVTKLGQLAKDLGQRLSDALSKLLRAEIKIDPAVAELRYASDVIAGEAAAGAFYVPLGETTAATTGFLLLPLAKAAELVNRFLGGMGGGNLPGRQLSPLERELLQDVVKAVVVETSAALVEAGGKAIVSQPLTNEAPAGLKDGELCCLILGGPAQTAITLAMQPKALENLVGAAQTPLPTQECLKRIQSHLGKSLLRASAWIEGVQLTMKDAAALEVGDVVPLSATIHQPVELHVAGRAVAFGTIAENNGQYALQITSRV